MNTSGYSVAVDGGTLNVHDLSVGDVGAQAPTVLLLHGITANGLAWSEVARSIGERFGPGTVRVLAPDLRGRAGSRDVVDPAGLAAHAQDVFELACAFGPTPLLVGHSMGAFVAALAAATHPERFAGVVLVDGGVGLPLPEGTTADDAIDAVVGPAMQRLRMTFPDQDAYVKFWQQHPAMGPLLDGPHREQVLSYLRHDLVPGASGFVSSCREDVVRADGRDVMVNADVAQAVWRLSADGVNAHLLWADRGLMNQTPGLYTEQSLAAAQLPEQVAVTNVGGNHYDVIFAQQQVAAIVDAIRGQLPTS